MMYRYSIFGNYKIASVVVERAEVFTRIYIYTRYRLYVWRIYKSVLTKDLCSIFYYSCLV